jgi:hypothetical protein
MSCNRFLLLGGVIPLALYPLVPLHAEAHGGNDGHDHGPVMNDHAIDDCLTVAGREWAGVAVDLNGLEAVWPP